MICKFIELNQSSPHDLLKFRIKSLVINEIIKSDTAYIVIKNRVDTPKVSPPPTEQPVKQNSTKYVPDEDKDKVFKYELLTENEEFKNT